MRGFSVVALNSPKDNNNIGAVIRAAGCYGAKMIVVSNARYSRASTDTQKGYRNTPLLNVSDLHDAIPFDCVPVAVDLIPGATPLPSYEHPARAFYVFGPEDGTLGGKTLSWCRDVVYVPTHFCMNLAATVNVILYDRMMKEYYRNEVNRRMKITNQLTPKKGMKQYGY